MCKWSRVQLIFEGLQTLLVAEIEKKEGGVTPLVSLFYPFTEPVLLKIAQHHFDWVRNGIRQTQVGCVDMKMFIFIHIYMCVYIYIYIYIYKHICI